MQTANTAYRGHKGAAAEATTHPLRGTLWTYAHKTTSAPSMEDFTLRLRVSQYPDRAKLASTHAHTWRLIVLAQTS